MTDELNDIIIVNLNITVWVLKFKITLNIMFNCLRVLQIPYGVTHCHCQLTEM